MKLEHPAVTRALRTGYPAPVKPAEPAGSARTVSGDEFAAIITRRLKAEKGKLMKTTTYICDICKTSVSKDDLISLDVGLTGDICIKDSDYRGAKQAHKDICKDCLRKKGFVIEPPENKDQKQEVLTKNQKTLESKIIDLLEDLGVAFAE